MDKKIMALAAIGVGIAALGAGPARAQDVLADPTEIRACLCTQQAVTALADILHERQQAYESSQKRLAALNSELETRRAQINVYDDAQVQAYKQLLQQRDSAATAFAEEATPSYNAAVARYNEALGGYTVNCAGKSYDGTAYRSVQATLACPKP